MAIILSKQDVRSTKARRVRSAEQHTEQNLKPIVIDVARSGDWMPAEELQKTVLPALVEGRDVTINLGNVEHLDTSALQILLALDAEQKRRGRNLQLINASSHLRQWFNYAGVAEQFLMTEQKSNE